MPTGNTAVASARLSVEALESRTVLSSFAANGGLSITWANIIPNIGSDEYVTGSGPGAGALSNGGFGPRKPGLVQIWDRQGNFLFEFQPFGNFRGGVFLASGNVDSDNETELVVSTGAGTTGRVKVYEFGFGGLQQVAAFTPFGPNYAGGVEIAVGNTSGGRSQEIVVGQQSLGSTVKVFTGVTSNNDLEFVQLRKFQPFGGVYIGGVSLAAANVDSTRNSLFNPYDFNYAEVLVGKATEEPRVKIFDVQEPTIDLRAGFMAFSIPPGFNLGVNLAAGSTDGQRGAEIYVNLKGTSRIRFFSGQTGILIGEVVPFGNSRMVNMAVRNDDDDFFDFYRISDLAVVRGDGPFNQIPIIYTGANNKPAGLNGGNPAA